TRLFYRERWNKGMTLDFARDVSDPPLRVYLPRGPRDARGYGIPNDGRAGGLPIVDMLGFGTADSGWTGWWYPALSSISASGLVAYDDASDRYVRSLPMLSLFDLLPVSQNRVENNS